MPARTKREYNPDRVSPPGDSLLSIIEERTITQAELARRMGRPTKTINEIVHGGASITPDTALELEAVLGTPAQFWLNREARYREFLARSRREAAARDALAWVRQFPLRSMASLGWIATAAASEDAVGEIFRFFGVASVQSWDDTWQTAEAQFRRSRSNVGKRPAVAAWLRKGEVDAAKVTCAPFSAKRFRDMLIEAKGLSCKPPDQFQHQLVALCAKAGVALVFVPELPGVPVHAVTRWASPQKALIQMSLYYKSDDHLWFSFFHEAAHVLSEKRRVVFLDDGPIESDDERQADAFASDFLIPPGDYAEFRTAGHFDSTSVRALATRLGISPGIVVGRLQHDRVIPFSHLNALKCRFRWAA